MQSLEQYWLEDWKAYRGDEAKPSEQANANALMALSAAALAGRTGPERNDTRARGLIIRLTGPWVYTPEEVPGRLWSDEHVHYPAWAAGGQMHDSIDTQIADALTLAWRARTALGLPKWLSDRIAPEVPAVAQGDYYAYPAVRLNQWNWAASMWCDAAIVDPSLQSRAASEYRKQLVALLHDQTTPLLGRRSPNFASGMGLLYNPGFAIGELSNTTTTSEYANIVYSGLDCYDQMLDWGMQPLTASDRLLLKRWGLRLLSGDWTHAGYLNWDSALSFNRWHLSRYWAFALDGLLTAATQTTLQPTSTSKEWASLLLGRAIELYGRLTAGRNTGAPPDQLFGVKGNFSELDDSPNTGARFASVAARAALAGVSPGEVAVSPKFSYDREVGRVAVSTSAYSTALIRPQPEGHYGGLELARLFNSAGVPIGGTGGTGEAAFSLLASRGGKVFLSTQPEAAENAPITQWTVRADGATRTAGNFKTLVASASVRAPKTESASVQHTFTEANILNTYSLTLNASARIELRFPIYGAGKAEPYLAGTVGPQIIAGAPGVSLLGRSVRISSEGGTYTVSFPRLIGTPKVSVETVERKRSNPRVGQVVEVAFIAPKGRTSLITKLAPSLG